MNKCCATRKQAKHFASSGKRSEYKNFSNSNTCSLFYWLSNGTTQRYYANVISIDSENVDPSFEHSNTLSILMQDLDFT